MIAEECPRFVPEAHRFKQVFEALEGTAPLAKKQLLSSLGRFLKKAKDPTHEEHPCPTCGEPTYYNPCPLCRLRQLQEVEAAAKAEGEPHSAENAAP